MATRKKTDILNINTENSKQSGISSYVTGIILTVLFIILIIWICYYFGKYRTQRKLSEFRLNSVEPLF